MSTHAKTPWYVGKSNFSAIPIHSVADKDFPVASTSANSTPKGMACTRSGENEANAKYIVLCVNAHDDLVSALQKIVDEGDYTNPEGMKKIARDALAKVEVQA